MAIIKKRFHKKSKATMGMQQHIHLLRESSLEKLTTYFAISILFLSLIFIHRLSDIDWQDIYLLDAFCILGGITIVLFRKSLSYKATILGYIGFALIAAGVEFIAVGIIGMGDIAALFCVMLSLFYMDKKTTVCVAAIVVVMYGFAMYHYVYNGWGLSENDMNYISWSSSWIGTFVAGAALFVLIGMSVYHLQSQMMSLLLELESQKKVINEQKQQIEYLANHDALTGLASVRLADQSLERAMKSAEKQGHISAVLFLDLDGFKVINDTHGHKAGDEVLKVVANRITSVTRAHDIVCRIGGDEFLLVIEKIEDKAYIEGLCQRLIKTVSAPFSYLGLELIVGVSIGGVCYPCDADSSKSLISKADDLMYEVKRSGKNNYKILLGENQLLKSQEKLVVTPF